MEVIEATIPLGDFGRPVRRVTPAHVVVLLVLAIAAVSLASQGNAAGKGTLTVRILDVGQGDAILIIAPNGNQVLVDGGPDSSVLAKLGAYLPEWDRDIELVVASHKHSDHISGLIAVLERYRAVHILQGYESYDSPAFRAWSNAVRDEGAQLTEAVAGTVVDVGSGVILTVLHPFASLKGTVTKDANNDSVVLLVEYGETSFLLTGDIEEEVEFALVSRGLPLDADILKVGHQGSKTSSTPAFLQAVSPELAVISVGARNSYGHPHGVVLSRLEVMKIPYFRTDLSGDVALTSDGESWSVSARK
ncbi:MAG TPA: ComEC/Rec2 family competence protein [Candidatus Paceibacterota bacterium]|nr:ComEC/Rec2 family competence protein [Candidatus Paceibacterota bacterium]